jgi:hypothetical protein
MEGGLELDNVTYAFVLLGDVIIYRLHKLALSDSPSHSVTDAIFQI